jgi:hypothetical protein
VFDDAMQFPAEMRGSTFVALKESWNRSEPTGDTVVRVPFQDGKPAGDYENFMIGFWAAGERHAEVWRRPAARTRSEPEQCTGPSAAGRLRAPAPRVHPFRRCFWL